MDSRVGEARRRPATIPVLMLHGVIRRPLPYVRFRDSRTCLLPLEDFQALLAWCVKDYDVIPLSALEAAKAGQGPRRPLVLTFDDGLASVIDHVLPLLQRYRVPAALFITTGWTDAGRAPAVFEIERLLDERVPATLSVHAGEREAAWRVGHHGAIGPTLAALWATLFAWCVPPLGLTWEHLRLDGAPVEPPPVDREFWHPATWGEVRQVGRSGLIEIGSHLRSHTPLSWLAGTALEDELRLSKERLERELGVPVIACSYPHGMWSDAVAEAAARWYRWGFANVGGVLRPGSFRLAAPRLHVPGERWTRARAAAAPGGAAVAWARASLGSRMRAR